MFFLQLIFQASISNFYYQPINEISIITNESNVTAENWNRNKSNNLSYVIVDNELDDQITSYYARHRGIPLMFSKKL